MNQGELTKESRENAVLNLYQNQGYQTERVERKTLLLVIESDKYASFTIKLQEPLRIDKLSDMYLDSFVTVNCTPGTAPSLLHNAGFILKLDQFNINTVAGSTNITTGAKLFNSIFIPNETTTPNTTVSHKCKKINYICSVNPSKIFTISGSLTALDGTGDPFEAVKGGRAIAEFTFISRN